MSGTNEVKINCGDDCEVPDIVEGYPKGWVAQTTQGYCHVCGRTIAEIEKWPEASRAEKKEIVRAAKNRKKFNDG